MTQVCASTPSVADIVAALSGRTAPPQADTAVLRAALAEMVGGAGPAASIHVERPERVVATLSRLETLAGQAGAITAPWLALRALAVKPGAQIGLDAAALADPIVAMLVKQAGLVATDDPDAMVRGHVGAPDDGRDPATLGPQARIVTLEGGCPTTPGTAATVATLQGTLMTLDLTDPAGAIASLEKSTTVRRAAKAAPIAVEINEGDITPDFATGLFAPYAVRRITIPEARPHPTDLVESAALASVPLPKTDYRPVFHPDIVRRGMLSDVQLEAVIYAGTAHSRYLPSHPDDSSKIAPRRGIVIGHGTGVGKGRISAGIIADNWAQNRRRHLWLSETATLIEDARADWVALGGRAEDVIDIREVSITGRIPPVSGIVFATYASLRAENGDASRLTQIVDWFGTSEDGVIVLDEAQNLRNAVGRATQAGFSAKTSRQGRAALDLQDALPNARVAYVSATSASDIAAMGYATRLGLWGQATAFPNSDAFFKEMDSGGTNALEMVARDLKAMGLYLAANLSFDGVKYERLERTLTPAERDAQDRLAAAWLDIHDGLKLAQKSTGATALGARKSIKGLRHKLGEINFSMARSRFFQALFASLNTPHTIEAIEADLAAGHSAVIQLTNTFAANADRAIDEAEAEGIDMSSVEATPRDIMVGYLRDHFPTVKLTTKKTGRHYTSVPLLDGKGNPVECPKACAERDRLIAQIEAIAIPEGPLEQIFRTFGPDAVAEISGRKRRLVPGPDGRMKVEERNREDTVRDLKAFMDDTKRVLVFSQAGGVGATYSAQRTARNQRLRRHYVLQPGWRADQALQGMGRSHRSNQVQPPEYILPTTDLWANRRMVSAVASGMKSLGALTRGLRQAASQDFFTADDSFEDDYAHKAWIDFLASISQGDVPNMTLRSFERQACIPLTTRSGQLKRPLPPLRRFLNAMSAMSCDDQRTFGEHFTSILEAHKVAAVEAGDFDRGIETIQPDSLVKLEDQVIYRDPDTGAESRLLQMLRVDHQEPISYQDARIRAFSYSTMRLAKSLMTGRVSMLCFPKLGVHEISKDDPVRVITPTGIRTRTRAQVVQEHWVPIDGTTAEPLWNAEMAEGGDEEEREFWVVTGAMMPIWRQLPSDTVTVFRMETDAGEQIIGRLVGEQFVDKLLTKVDALASGGLPLADVAHTLETGGMATLANGWTIEGRRNRITGKQRVTLSLPESEALSQAALLRKAGLVQRPSPLMDLAAFGLPDDATARESALTTLLGHSPAVSATAF